MDILRHLKVSRAQDYTKDFGVILFLLGPVALSALAGGADHLVNYEVFGSSSYFGYLRASCGHLKASWGGLGPSWGHIGDNWEGIDATNQHKRIHRYVSWLHHGMIFAPFRSLLGYLGFIMA